MRSYVVIALSLVACGGDPSSQLTDADLDDDASTASDASSEGDAGVDAPVVDPPLTCGTETCRAGETCESGTCTAAPCMGATVPGDYATIQSAATALAAAGNDATICLANQEYPAPVGNTILLDDIGNHGKTLRIVGQGRDRSRITARFSIGQQGWSKITFEGVQITAPSQAAIGMSGFGNVEVIASRLRGPDGIEAFNGATLRVDGTVFEVTNYGISLFHNTPTAGDMKVRVENSVFLADGYAIDANSGVPAAKMSITVVGSTFFDVDVGIDLNSIDLGGGITATISNSIFTDIGGHAIAWSPRDTVTHTSNALWNNTPNYSGIASDGPGYVKVDCLLTSTSPTPTPGAGSPCRDAADSAHATTHDFYGVVRGSPADIGAAEAL